ncbi:uncharacterized protein PHALS_06020 [Plasmopara halstedii]|uniref:Uncharacterized protein n=1 Tax=Plasmopara halstedii TaxID=4781 RepID=A0A0P1AB55_PLAHL|nr:uncharacterized protein PHALS_06020 [Plasmopara halstedii]CEG37975.1 hypothetical protein PHALS_06020 [Plasmopara halstedii]|eukprot:XP_024574344.1 hypothetical protein PHALS_06020 [Plasmopara halstedii]
MQTQAGISTIYPSYKSIATDRQHGTKLNIVCTIGSEYVQHLCGFPDTRQRKWDKSIRFNMEKNF